MNQTIDLFDTICLVHNKNAEAHRPSRQDGEQSRARLLRVGLALFAQQGFAKTSTREIAEAAHTNIAAISYYFGDKAGLYRAVFFEPLGEPQPGESDRIADPSLPLDDALRGFYATFLEPLALGEDGRRCVKLRMREMIEPTGLWHQEVDQGIRPLHDALVTVICRHLGLDRADDAVHRLVVCLAALGVHLHLGRDVIDTLAPQLNQATDSVAQWAACLQQQALAMIDHEKRRREAAPPAAVALSDTPHTAPGAPAA
jgi:AcrR family transcriptional regulator